MLTKPQRRTKAKILTGLIQQLDVRDIVRQNLANQCLEAEDPRSVQAIYDATELAFQMINQAATEGPLPYARSDDRLKQPAE